jgi:hypothetical protein
MNQNNSEETSPVRNRHPARLPPLEHSPSVLSSRIANEFVGGIINEALQVIRVEPSVQSESVTYGMVSS